MLTCTHRTLIRLSGVLWLAIGILLLYLGITRLMTALTLVSLHEPGSNWVLNWLAFRVGGAANGAVLLVIAGLAIGYLKGRLVLKKSIGRIIDRIKQLPQPVAFSRVYGWKYLLLLITMMGLGFVLRLIGAPEDIRGIILVAVGSGLARASLVAFRAAQRVTYDKEILS